MKLLYLTSWDFTHPETDGVCKKIEAQIREFQKAGYQTDCIYINNGSTCLRRDNGRTENLGFNNHLSKFWAHKRAAQFLKKRGAEYDCAYVRHNMADPWILSALHALKESGAAIVMEIPMFPYVKEAEVNLRSWGCIIVDFFYKNGFRKYIDRIASYVEIPEILGIKTLHIINGIDFEQVDVIHTNEDKPQQDGNTINLIAVALFAAAHGYDRMIDGLHRYYAAGGKRNIIFHMVGDGLESERYRKMVRCYHLENHVILYGRKSGNELDDIYNKADIGVSALGQFRQVSGAHVSSTLKSREYMAKGLPIISGCEIDVAPSDQCDFVWVCGNVDEPVNIDDLIGFYDRCYNGRDRGALISRIRKYGEEHCSMRTAIEPVARYYREQKHDEDSIQLG